MKMLQDFAIKNLGDCKNKNVLKWLEMCELFINSICNERLRSLMETDFELIEMAYMNTPSLTDE